MKRYVKCENARRRDHHSAALTVGPLPDVPNLRCAAQFAPNRPCGAPAAATIGEPGHEYTLCEQHLRQALALGLKAVMEMNP